MMAEIEGSLADDRQVIGCVGGCGTKSPWKTTASSAEAPVMGAHSWPALSNAASNNPPTSIRTPAQDMFSIRISSSDGRKFDELRVELITKKIII